MTSARREGDHQTECLPAHAPGKSPDSMRSIIAGRAAQTFNRSATTGEARTAAIPTFPPTPSLFIAIEIPAARSSATTSAIRRALCRIQCTSVGVSGPRVLAYACAAIS